MNFKEAFSDLTVKAVRLSNWAAPHDHLEMPVVINGHRTPWCYLVEQFPREGHDGRTAILSVQMMDDAGDWQRYEPASPASGDGCVEVEVDGKPARTVMPATPVSGGSVDG